MPGHWEEDLILGAGGASAVGTLIKRNTRLVGLLGMATRKDNMAASALAGALNAILALLRKMLTYDQGKEMAGHAGLTAQTGMRIFSADPYFPWQRGSNGNTIEKHGVLSLNAVALHGICCPKGQLRRGSGGATRRWFSWAWRLMRAR